jgi:3-hydroxyisobutyrate dehydrogenase-like beta-hydroxyacid dehydrogenase
VSNRDRIGWIGVGRMGRPLVTRLLRAGCDVTIYNRTRAKAESLVELGARLVDTAAELADRDIVFSVVSASDDFEAVMTGPSGVLSNPNIRPRVLVDSSTISAAASARVRVAVERAGAQLVAAPISGNGEHVARGGALFAVSGPAAAVELVRPYLEVLGRGAHHVGDGDAARLVKIAHNQLLGAIIQSLVETTLLIEAAGLDRRRYLDFINASALGSVFSTYKTAALVDLDWSPTFSATLLRKDLDLGLDAAAELGIALPVSSVVRDEVQSTIDAGYGEQDFAALLITQAAAYGLTLKSPAGVEPSRDRTRSDERHVTHDTERSSS